MQLGFLTAGTVEDVAFAARHGFGCLELALFGDTPLFADHRDFAAALRDAALPLAAVSLFGQNYRDPAPARRQKALDRLERAADLAAALGAPVFVTGTGADPGRPEEQQWDEAAEEMAPRVAAIQRRGLHFAFYNCHWANVMLTPAAWQSILPRIPGAGLKFDPSHPAYAGRDWMPELLAAGPALLHAHAKDVLRVGDRIVADPNPGLGQIAWGPFFALLYEAGYGGAVCIEPHSRLYTGEARERFLLLSQRHLTQFLVPEPS